MKEESRSRMRRHSLSLMLSQVMAVLCSDMFILFLISMASNNALMVAAAISSGKIDFNQEYSTAISVGVYPVDQRTTPVKSQ